MNSYCVAYASAYYLSKSRTGYITFFSQHALKMSSSGTLTPLANRTFNNNARPRAAHSLLMRNFSTSTYKIEMNTINVKYVTDLQRFCGLSYFLSRRIRYSALL